MPQFVMSLSVGSVGEHGITVMGAETPGRALAIRMLAAFLRLALAPVFPHSGWPEHMHVCGWNWVPTQGVSRRGRRGPCEGGQLHDSVCVNGCQWSGTYAACWGCSGPSVGFGNFSWASRGNGITSDWGRHCCAWSVNVRLSSADQSRQQVQWRGTMGARQDGCSQVCFGDGAVVIWRCIFWLVWQHTKQLVGHLGWCLAFFLCVCRDSSSGIGPV